MPASFLHGVETIEIEKGARTIRTVKTAVVGLVGTAPIDDVDAEFRTVNEPTLILNEIDAVKYFG
jgi:phage tail sheath protein FI